MLGTLTFTVVPSTESLMRGSSPVHAMHVKAFFDYDPEEDYMIPCKSVSFTLFGIVDELIRFYHS